MSQDTINRNVYGRVFRGTHDQMSDTGPWDLIGAVFDRTYMPALLLESGKNNYYSFSAGQGTTNTIVLPQEYDSANRLYIAVQVDLKAQVRIVSPVDGTSNVILLGTDSDDDGTHAAFFTYQGRVTSLTILIPATVDGGVTASVQVFMYEIPDLSDFESYFDKQIGLGVSGDN